MKISILGGGVYGQALASYFSSIKHEVLMDEVRDCEIIFVCTPSHEVVNILSKYKEDIENKKIVICSKGFVENGKLISESIKEKFNNSLFFLYGPTLAKELENGTYSGMVLSCGEGVEEIKKQIESKKLFIELSDDVIGVEISATLKNAYATLIGIIAGAGYGEDTTALFFSKSVREIKDIGISMGARPETFLGLSCVGDLFLASRNRVFGVEIGKGKRMEDIIKETNYTPAGVFALKDSIKMLEKRNLEAPILEHAYKIVFENYSIENSIKEIINI